MPVKHGMAIKDKIWIASRKLIEQSDYRAPNVVLVPDKWRKTHDIVREDLGIQMVRFAEYGVNNRECVAIFHADYIVAFERIWPDWDLDDPRDREKRKLGKLHFYVSGDYHKITEAAVMLSLSDHK